MKKLISLLAVAGSVLVIGAMFTGCGDKKNSSDSKADTSSSQAEISEDKKEGETEEETTEVPKLSSIIGEWKSDDGTAYTFNEDGTGVYNDGVDDSSFTYTEKNFGITITFNEDEEPLKYDYVAAGTQLILKDKNESNEEFVFHKE